MIKKIFVIVFFACIYNLQAQVENDTIDNKYLEDQLYFSITYNILTDRPKIDDNSVFSGGLTLGFIKDLPINKQRNIGFGIGLGYSFNSYKNKITLYPDDVVGIDKKYLANKLKTHLIEIPLELRWRTSTPTKYSFWRIYGGLRLAYVFHSKANFENEEGSTFSVKNSDLINDFQYGLTLAAGYGTWNLYFYYGLTPLFNSFDVNGKEIKMKDFNIGLKFYIL